MPRTQDSGINPLRCCPLPAAWPVPGGQGLLQLSRRGQLQADPADAKHVAILQARRGAHPRAVDVRAVGRTEVRDLDPVADAPDQDMVP